MINFFHGSLSFKIELDFYNFAVAAGAGIYDSSIAIVMIIAGQYLYYF